MMPMPHDPRWAGSLADAPEWLQWFLFGCCVGFLVAAGIVLLGVMTA